MRKYGKKVYDDSYEIKCKDIGIYICPTCHRPSRLIHRKGRGFQNILSVCDKGHTCEIAKSLHEKYHIGDRIRLYYSTFGKNAVLRLDSYTEGIIIDSYPGITDYQFDFKIDKCIMSGKEIKAPAWIIGHVSQGIYHSSTEVKLIRKAKKETYEQLSFVNRTCDGESCL